MPFPTRRPTSHPDQSAQGREKRPTEPPHHPKDMYDDIANAVAGAAVLAATKMSWLERWGPARTARAAAGVRSAVESALGMR